MCGADTFLLISDLQGTYWKRWKKNQLPFGSSFCQLLKWLEAVPSGLPPADLVVHFMLLPLFFGEWCLWEGVLGDVPVQEEVRLALSLISAGVVCCDFLQRILGKQPEEPPDLRVRISEYLDWWRTEGSHNHYSHGV